MKIEVVPFEDAHLQTLGPLSDEDLRWCVNDFPEVTWQNRVKWQAMSGPSYSVLADGKACRTSASTLSVPSPRYRMRRLQHTGHRSGTARR